MYRNMKQSRSSWAKELEKSSQLQQMLSTYRYEREAHIAELNEKKTNAEKAVDAFYNKVLRQVETMKEKTLKIFNTQNRIIQRETRETLTKCAESSAKLEKVCKDLETADSTQKESVNAVLSGLEQEVVDMLSKHTHTEYLFTGSAELMEFLEKQDHLGMVSVLDKLSPVAEIPSAVECVTCKSPVIHAGCCRLSNDTLVIGDTENSLLIECGGVTIEHEVSGKINSLCQVAEEDIIALIHPRERKIHMYRTSPFKHLTSVISAELQEDICGISKYKDGFLVASPKSDPPCVYITDRNGSPSSSIGTDPFYDEGLFENPRFTASKPSGEMVVCDIRTDGIHVFYFRPDGDLDWKRLLSGVTNMTGVSVEPEGNIFVCGTNPYCVFELNLFGFIERSFPYPRGYTAITFNANPFRVICRTENQQFTEIISKYPSVWS